MVTVTYTKRQNKPRILGICNAAEKLGVSRQHVYLVIRGTRRSPRIERWLQHNMRRAS